MVQSSLTPNITFLDERLWPVVWNQNVLPASGSELISILWNGTSMFQVSVATLSSLVNGSAGYNMSYNNFCI